jgi:hypothetical protein
MSVTGWENIHGWFRLSDSKIHEMAAQRFEDGSIFVEIGCFKGRSCLSMVSSIINSGKKIDFFCVDHFEGSVEHQAGAANEDNSVVNKTLYQEYISNIEPYKKYINTMKMSSEEACFSFDDISIDFVYIDASHDYENVSKDIDMWSKKVKPGGIISGHDWDSKPVEEAVKDFCTKNNLRCANQYGSSWHIEKG